MFEILKKCREANSVLAFEIGNSKIANRERNCPNLQLIFKKTALKIWVISFLKSLEIYLFVLSPLLDIIRTIL